MFQMRHSSSYTYQCDIYIQQNTNNCNNPPSPIGWLLCKLVHSHSVHMYQRKKVENFWLTDAKPLCAVYFFLDWMLAYLKSNEVICIQHPMEILLEQDLNNQAACYPNSSGYLLLWNMFCLSRAQKVRDKIKNDIFFFPHIVILKNLQSYLFCFV